MLSDIKDGILFADVESECGLISLVVAVTVVVVVVVGVVFTGFGAMLISLCEILVDLLFKNIKNVFKVLKSA